MVEVSVAVGMVLATGLWAAALEWAHTLFLFPSISLCHRPVELDSVASVSVTLLLRQLRRRSMLWLGRQLVAPVQKKVQLRSRVFGLGVLENGSKGALEG